MPGGPGAPGPSGAGGCDDAQARALAGLCERAARLATLCERAFAREGGERLHGLSDCARASRAAGVLDDPQYEWARFLEDDLALVGPDPQAAGRMAAQTVLARLEQHDALLGDWLEALRKRLWD